MGGEGASEILALCDDGTLWRRIPVRQAGEVTGWQWVPIVIEIPIT